MLPDGVPLGWRPVCLTLFSNAILVDINLLPAGVTFSPKPLVMVSHKNISAIPGLAASTSRLVIFAFGIAALLTFSSNQIVSHSNQISNNKRQRPITKVSKEPDFLWIVPVTTKQFMLTLNQRVVGSNPSASTILHSVFLFYWLGHSTGRWSVSWDFVV